MVPKKLVMLFPGQGACYPSVMRAAAGSYSTVRDVFQEVDRISTQRFGRAVTDLIWDPAAPGLEHMVAAAPDLVQLAIYAVSVACFRLYAAEGIQPDVLAGHSFGEIAALTCAGAFTVAEGAEIVCGRTEATRVAANTGYMAALSADLNMATAMVALTGDAETVVAAQNAPLQTIVSGTAASMDQIAAIAKVLNVGFLRLKSPYPFHSPLMEPARNPFRSHVEGFTA